MLKRYQILLDDWLADYMKYRANTYGTSFSECVRVALCASYLLMVADQYPEYKPDIGFDDVNKLVKKFYTESHDIRKMDEALSKVYFEARKAVEYAWDKERNIDKNKSNG